MKFLTAFFIVLITPLVVFLTTILYGGISSNLVKNNLEKAQVYQKITGFIAEAQEEGEPDEFTKIFGKYLTPDYLKSKTEEVIDNSFNFVSGKSSTPPVVSFVEIKEGIMKSNPELLSSLENLPKELENQQTQLQEGGISESNNQDLSNGMNELRSLVKSDFKINLENYLRGFKSSYSVIKILHPILLVLLLGSVVLLRVLSGNWHSFFKWAAATFLITGILGFGAIYISNFGVSGAGNIISKNTNELVVVGGSIFIRIANNFLEAFTKFQTWTSIFLIIASIGNIIGFAITKGQPTLAKIPKPRKIK